MGPTTIGNEVQLERSATPTYKPVYDAFNVNGLKQRDVFVTRSRSIPPQGSPVWSDEGFSDRTSTPQPSSVSNSPPRLPRTPVLTPQSSSMSLPSQQSIIPNPLERQTTFIYSAPNVVEDQLKSKSDERLPKKAAGDVSLTAEQCIAFIYKACRRLHPVKCEGVQIKLEALKEQIQKQGMTEPCVKKLNFVVDALDREQYDEAWAFFDQWQQKFPEQMGSWTQGMKIMISELKRTYGRVGSAGSQRLKIS
ncbi:unnamed protein product, partial [Mesorhabditis spiculigera]